jgi:hypothetical protein
MPTGSKLYLSWLDFCGYLSDFEDFVYDGVFHKMDYHMWRRLKYSRDNETQVVIQKWGNSFDVIIGHEDEYHHFCRGDESFGDFLFENLIDVKEYDHDWNEYKMPLSNSLNVPITEAKVQSTSSSVYPVKNYKLDIAAIESAKNIAIDCGEALKSSLAITKDKLADIGISAIAADTAPTLSCVIDTKVDKADFDKRLDDLTSKVENVLNEYENKKENSTMKGFNFDFGPMNSNVVRMSVYGMAVKNKVGTWVSYDAKAGEIMDVDVFNFEGSKFMYKMPVAINDVAVGDIIVHMSVPMFVIGKAEDGKAVIAVDPVSGERKEIMLTKSPFGFNFVTKVVNFLGNAFNADANNPFGNLGLMMMLSEDGNGVKDMLPLMLMANGGNIDMSNPLMMYALMSGDGKMSDMLPFMLMMNANKPAVVHECHCGEHHE